MWILDGMTLLLLGGGGIFFLAGTLGLLRFPDAHTRLHALAKADNLGLGLVTAGLILQADTAGAAVKLALIWTLALLASGTSAYLIARSALPGVDLDDGDG